MLRTAELKFFAKLEQRVQITVRYRLLLLFALQNMCTSVRVLVLLSHSVIYFAFLATVQ